MSILNPKSRARFVFKFKFLPIRHKIVTIAYARELFNGAYAVSAA